MADIFQALPVGVLSKQDIDECIDAGLLIRNANKNRLEACSYDMAIGTIFREGQVVNEIHPEANRQVIIEPGEVVSMFTKEELDLPNNISATAFAINSQSSRGLLVLNPGHVDPGFKGPLTVKALNLRKVPLAIGRGSPIFTVIFEKLPKATTAPYARNVPREERERRFNEGDVEASPKSLSQLILLGKNAPFPTRHEVKEIVRDHWMSRTALILTLIAALAAAAGVALQLINGAGYELLGDSKPKSPGASQ